jgi:hypothetical protein
VPQTQIGFVPQLSPPPPQSIASKVYSPGPWPRERSEPPPGPCRLCQH